MFSPHSHQTAPKDYKKKTWTFLNSINPKKIKTKTTNKLKYQFKTNSKNRELINIIVVNIV